MFGRKKRSGTIGRKSRGAKRVEEPITRPTAGATISGATTPREFRPPVNNRRRSRTVDIKELSALGLDSVAIPKPLNLPGRGRGRGRGIGMGMGRGMGRGRGMGMGMGRGRGRAAGPGAFTVGGLMNARNIQEELPKFDVSLTAEQLKHFQREGYLVIPNVIPKELTRNARAAINASLGRGIDKEAVEAFRIVKGGLGWCRELAGTPVMTDLFYRSPAATYVRQLVGSFHQVHGCQIALRFPSEFALKSPNGLYAPEGWEKHWHIDGVASARLNLPAGTVLQFTLLCGILIADVKDPLSGNLTVYPQGHRVLSKYFVEQKNLEGSLQTASERPPLAFPVAPKQICGSEGDLVLCHWALPHCVAPNTSPDIRYCSYFRVTHSDHVPGKFRPEAVADLTLEFDGLKHL